MHPKLISWDRSWLSNYKRKHKVVPKIYTALLTSRTRCRVKKKNFANEAVRFTNSGSFVNFSLPPILLVCSTNCGVAWFGSTARRYLCPGGLDQQFCMTGLNRAGKGRGGIRRHQSLHWYTSLMWDFPWCHSFTTVGLAAICLVLQKTMLPRPPAEVLAE